MNARSAEKTSRWYWGASVGLHLGLLFLLIFHPEFFSKRFVIEQGKNADQQVIQAVMVQEPAPQKRVTVAVSPSSPVKPATLPVRNPVTVRKQLLADLKKDMVRQKHPQAVSAQQKILNAHALQKQLLQEKTRVDGIRSARTQGEVDRYRALILQVISQNWHVPGIPDKRLYAELLIHLAPGGVVLDVQVTRSSGNAGLDGSARAAVFRSSPLPVPANPDAFEAFRSFLLKVKPENILATNS